MNDSPRDFDNPRYIGIDWGANPGKPIYPKDDINVRNYPYKTISVPLNGKIVRTFTEINQALYGDDDMPKTKRKKPAKAPKPTKREKQLLAKIDEKDRIINSTREYYQRNEEAWKKTFEEKKKETEVLSGKVSDLVRDKAFLQQVIQHLVPAKH